MLDVIHVIFEDDLIPRWEQDTEVKSKMRSVLYREMYKREYKYGISDPHERHADWDTPSSSMFEAPPDGSIKPYIPPTPQEEFQNILDSPMGQ